jgi:putative flippase GtrA
MIVKLHHVIRDAILTTVDFFYPPFKKFMSLQVFRYAVCGGTNTALSTLWYYIGYNFIFKKQSLDLFFFKVPGYIAAEYFFAIWITYPLGFYLSRYIIFEGSALKTQVQLFRYILVLAGMIVLNYILLRLFIEVFKWYPTFSKAVTTVFIVIYSYFSQRLFAFKKPRFQPAQKK